ncbi:MAG: type II toxin-antitoxin system RelE/ParE family toxin [Nitrospira sp.]|nr:type II toxin-antitoxin system RelE/ParE family toxin [Nitrospira sp.]
MSTGKFTLRLLSLAEQDFTDIIEYVASENLTAAHRIADRIEQDLQRLQQYPFLGKVPADPKLAKLGYRVLLVEEYLIFYKARGKTVLVYRIIHGARDTLPLLEEL